MSQTSTTNKVSGVKKVEITPALLDEELRQILLVKCRHVVWAWHGIAEFTCTRACNYIKERIEEGYKFSDEILSFFFKELYTGKQETYYEREKCIYKDPQNISNTLSLIFSTHDLSSHMIQEHLDILIKFMLKETNSYDHCIKILANIGYDFSEKLELIIESRFKGSKDSSQDEKLATTVMEMLDQIEITPEALLQLCNCRHTALCNKTASIVDKYAGALGEAHLEQACYVLPYSNQLVMSILSRKIKMTDTCLNIVCQYAPAESLDLILSITRSPITKTQFQKVIDSKDWSGNSQSNYYYYRRNNSNYISYNNDNSQEKVGPKMEALIKHGYKPDYDDVVYAVSRKIEIPGVERFGITLDKELLEKCWDHDFYPQGYKFDCIDPKMIELQKLCSSRAKVQIGKLLKQHKLTPDRKCMENSCNFANNQVVLDLLIKSGGKLSYKCIRNCANQLKSNQMLIHIIDEYEKTHNKELEELKTKIEELEKKIQFGGIVLEQKGDKTPKKITEKKSDTQKIEEETKKNNHDEDADKEDNDDMNGDENDSENEKKAKDGEKKNPAHELIEIDQIDDMEDGILEEIAQSNKIVNIDESRLNKIPKQKRIKGKIPKKYAEYFELSEKERTQKMSFIDLKKDLIDRIRLNKWYDQDDQQLIKLPHTLSHTLKIKDGYIKFGEIEKLLGLFYC